MWAASRFGQHNNFGRHPIFAEFDAHISYRTICAVLGSLRPYSQPRSKRPGLRRQEDRHKDLLTTTAEQAVSPFVLSPR